MRKFEEIVERSFDAGADDLGALLRVAYQGFLDQEGTSKPETPIEHALAVAMVATSVGIPMFELMTAKEGSDAAKRREVTRKRALVTCQAPVGRYRVDFLIDVMLDGASIGKIVVECDGHDFHERTKEQAARDRSRDREMTVAGYKVLRFTGSEIYRQPISCAWDIASVVNAMVDEVDSRAP